MATDALMPPPPVGAAETISASDLEEPPAIQRADAVPEGHVFAPLSAKELKVRARAEICCPPVPALPAPPTSRGAPLQRGCLPTRVRCQASSTAQLSALP